MLKATLMRCSPDLSSSSTLKGHNHAAALQNDSVTPCSGRGDCLNGTCLCEIRYAGDECASFNLPYHAGMYRCKVKIKRVYWTCKIDNIIFSRRCIISVLLCCCLINSAIINMLYRWIPTIETTIHFTSIPFNYTEATLFCCFYSSSTTWCILYDAGTFF